MKKWISEMKSFRELFAGDCIHATILYTEKMSVLGVGKIDYQGVRELVMERNIS